MPRVQMLVLGASRRWLVSCDAADSRHVRECPVTTKRPFDIDLALERIDTAVEPFAKAALFELYDDGYVTPFEQLAACMISIRTRDETTLPTARALVRAGAHASRSGAAARWQEIDALIRRQRLPRRPKRRRSTPSPSASSTKFDGQLPCDSETLQSFAGVGPKCANLVLGIACGQPRIGVDIHVHRVTNRWGYVEARTPEQTMVALEAKLPRALLGGRSTGCWCRSASTSAPARGPAAPPARCWTCASRSA